MFVARRFGVLSAQRLVSGLAPRGAVGARWMSGTDGTNAQTAPSKDKAAPQTKTATQLSSDALMAMDATYGAHNYHPLPVVFSTARGMTIWDPEGRSYYDFLSAYSAVNQGHNHPRILEAIVNQAQKVSLSSRAFYNDQFPVFAKKITQLFGYDRVLPMNTGAEAVETGLKIAKKWAYDVKGVPYGEAQILSACGCFHGRTAGAVSMSCDPEATHGFAPHVPGHLKVDFDDLGALEAVLEEHGETLAAFIVEPIQGEAGVVVPSEGYLATAHELCKKHSVLLIADEIQTGLARTGRMLASEHDGVRADIVLLGKALGGGLYPISAVLADAPVMDVITPNTHGSTFGGNPLASAVGIASLDVLVDEDMCATAERLGERLRSEIIAMDSPIIDTVRGRGLLNAIVFDHKLPANTAWDVCLSMKDRGLLAKPTHGHIVRLAPPLTLDDDTLDQCLAIIRAAVEEQAMVIEQGHDAPDAPAGDADPLVCERCGRDLDN